jgi:hypothetical protein
VQLESYKSNLSFTLGTRVTVVTFTKCTSNIVAILLLARHRHEPEEHRTLLHDSNSDRHVIQDNFRWLHMTNMPPISLVGVSGGMLCLRHQ